MYTMLHVSKRFWVYLANESNHVKSFSTIFLVTLRQHCRASVAHQAILLPYTSCFQWQCATWRSTRNWTVAAKPLLVDDVFFGYTALHMGNPFWLTSTSSTAQGGGGSFKNRKPIGEVGCCESGMAKRIHWWTERCLSSPLCLSLSLTIYLPIYLLCIYLSSYLSLSFSLSSNYLSTYLPTYLSIYLSLSLFHLSICLAVYLSIYLSICLSVYLSICGAVSFSVL